ncbi:unnamed protein product [Ilex paraguariensis]|uniref:Uncharacterized protein n=1 Tax=Ilex paraguariensis TaxID=185542 RepID=A0ABC8UFU4_9AQUA
MSPSIYYAILKMLVKIILILFCPYTPHPVSLCTNIESQIQPNSVHGETPPNLEQKVDETVVDENEAPPEQPDDALKTRKPTEEDPKVPLKDLSPFHLQQPTRIAPNSKKLRIAPNSKKLHSGQKWAAFGI